jgi:hypothetical protein
VGVKFRSDVDGFITAIRFYKGPLNTGTHTASLWTSTGTLLTRVTFANETASGWQEVTLPTPAAITANTVYVASYHAPVGRYSITENYFTTAGVDNPPLHALATTQSPNGVYRYASGSAFPNQTFLATNYWVDVVFTTTSGDSTPPTVATTSPANGATGVAVGANILATFSEPMTPTSITTSTFELRDQDNVVVPAAVSYNATSRVATLNPTANLASGRNYTATVRSGPTGVKDLSGNPMAADFVWFFKTSGTDSTPPSVTAFTPADGATGVATSTTVTATFAEAMNASTITSSTFTLTGPEGAVPTTVAYDPATRRATLTPAAQLATATTYVARVVGGASGVKDLAGLALAADVTWSFTTGGQDSTPPTVVSTTPTNGATDVSRTTTVTATFSEAMDGATIDGARFRLAGPGGAQVPASVAYNATTRVATLTPTDQLAEATAYTATVVGGANGVKDLAGNALAADHTWSFTTAGTAPPPGDITPPTVSATAPTNGATGVATDTRPTATFSEPMDPTTINGTTVELRDPDNAIVAALVEYNATTRTVTITPTSLLAGGATYTGTIRGGATDPRAKDVAGNALAANFVWSFSTGQACTSNPIVCENQKPGNPPGEWDVAGAGDDHIQGFATDISVNKGETVRFKVDSTASAYRLDIYRMGYYGGDGARKVATVSPTVGLPQSQPACLSNATTGLIDCGNWAESASWTVPVDATSGIYFAKLVTEAGPSGSSHIFFVVRDDQGQSPILFQTSDTTWQAYNQYGGNSLYVGSPAGRAFKVSYNRPFTTRGTSSEDWVFNAEYPMVRWLESNGYHVSYWTGVDTDRRGAQLLQQHRVFLSVGHDEYWSGAQRANVEAARNAGVHLGFFSGNEVFWKTRWENSIDGSNTPYRTLVSYKETHANDKIDPTPVWTGTWRDPRFSPPADGGRPENALTGTLFTVNDGATTAVVVPEADGKMRFWRNTSVANLAAGTSATMPQGTVGYEWDEDVVNGFRPPGLFRLSSATVNVPGKLQDFGSTYGPGTATHSLTMYRHASGALVFGAGTIQWSWGLDSEHDRGSAAADVRMQQATVNLLADMGVQPATLQAGLVPATPSTDATAPVSTITAPESGANVPVGQPVVITGTATDSGGGRVAGVEVSVDNGASWQPATGRGSWTFNWTPGASGTVTLKSRAVDDSGNLEAPSAGVTVTVGSGGGGGGCPCSLFASSATPAVVSDPDTAAIELGVKFSSSVDGAISAIRFYKGPLNTGTHVGKLWTSTGQLLASVTFTNETSSGWQQANFATPVAITANTLYVASYHTSSGRYSVTENFFASGGVSNGSLSAPANTVTPNGVYLYGSGGFPTNTFAATNYWVDVVFGTSTAPDTTPPTITAMTPAEGATDVSVTTTVTATFSEPMDASTIATTTFELTGPGNVLVAASVAYDSTTRVATLTPTSPLATSTTYVATVRGGSTDPRVKDVAGNALASSFSWSFTTSATGPPPSGCPCTIWTPTTTPAVASANDNSAVELGVKFRSDLDGFVIGVRFYKGSANTGTHVGKIWSLAGELLGSVTFTNETASGWQQANFGTPIPITANTTYVASYHTSSGFYAADEGYFASSGTDRPPLHALSSATSGGNGVYQYGPGPGGFPAQTFNATNYWVDVVFNTTATLPPDTTPPTVTAVRPSSGAGGIAPGVTVAVTFSEAMDPATIGAGSIELRGPGNSLVESNISYDAASRTATVDPASSLAVSSTFTLTVRGGGGDPRVKDVAGNAMAANFTSSFSTATGAPLPPLGQGPGGPILVITTDQNKFGTYYSEILYAEGLNLFAVADASAISPSGLSGSDVVILGEMSLTATQVTTLTDWVNAGGNLIAMRPDKQLAPLLGLADTSTTLADAYLLIETSEPPGQGLVGQTIQFHGPADRYTLAGATAVATLYSSATAATSNPAVTLRSVGGLGGHAAAFTYDLAKSVVYTRQGNVAWDNEERDGVSPIRSDDLYFGNASSDPQPDWVDLDKVAIPQADEQQRLLANLIAVMNADRKPLPRFWYLPRGLKAVVVMSGDDHANGGTAGRFEQFLAASPPGCDVDNWECVRGTSYIYVSSAMSDAQAARYHGLGFEIGLHILTGCADWTPSSLTTFYDDQLGEFSAAYPSIPAPSTNRTHCIAWSDWSTQALVESARSIGLDTNYYYWPPSWINDRAGFFTGSGMPMRFAGLDGTLIDTYQATTQMTDESGQEFPVTVNTLLDRALGPQGYYGVFTANMHTDLVDSPGADAIVASAQARGVPIVTSRQMLEWLDGRNGSSFTGVSWNGVALGFTIEVGIGANGLQAMVPAQFGGQTLTGISLGGAPVSFTLRTIKGVEYATFPTAPGAYEATYGSP